MVDDKLLTKSMTIHSITHRSYKAYKTVLAVKQDRTKQGMAAQLSSTADEHVFGENSPQAPMSLVDKVIGIWHRIKPSLLQQ